MKDEGTQLSISGGYRRDSTLSGTLTLWLIRGIHCLHLVALLPCRIGARSAVEFVAPPATARLSKLTK